MYILGETSGYNLLVEDGRVVGVRSGDKGRGRDGQELSNFEPGSDLIAKATVLAEGTAGHLTGAAIRHFELGSEDPQQWELGVKEVWEVQQPLDRVIHTMGWPLQVRREVPRVRRLVHLPDGRGQGVDGARGRARLPRRALLGPRRAPGAEVAPDGGEDHRGREASRLGGEDDPLGRLLGAAAAALGSRHDARGRRRRHGQRADAQGRPLRDARGHVRRRGDLRATEGRRQLRRPLELPGEGRGLRDRDGHATARATCASRSRRASSSAARSPA